MRNTDKVEVFCGYCDSLYEAYYKTTLIAKEEGRPTFCSTSCYWKWADVNKSDQFYIDKFWRFVDKDPNLPQRMPVETWTKGGEKKVIYPKLVHFKKN